MGLFELDDPVHLKGPSGFPICWHIEEIGVFEGVFLENEVTCADCLSILEEE